MNPQSVPREISLELQHSTSLHWEILDACLRLNSSDALLAISFLLDCVSSESIALLIILPVLFSSFFLTSSPCFIQILKNSWIYPIFLRTHSQATALLLSSSSLATVRATIFQKESGWREGIRESQREETGREGRNFDYIKSFFYDSSLTSGKFWCLSPAAKSLPTFSHLLPLLKKSILNL